uniref:Uncharacterized protein n=1 Tax=Vitis vinifera TaxID=29760 RepID=F6I6W7_VITVI
MIFFSILMGNLEVVAMHHFRLPEGIALYRIMGACLGSPEIGLLNMKLVRKRSKLSG